MARKKSNRQLWAMLALIALILAVILLLPSCGQRVAAAPGARCAAKTPAEAGYTAPAASGAECAALTPAEAGCHARTSIEAGCAAPAAAAGPGASRPTDEEPAPEAQVAAGDEAPGFTVELFDGSRIALESLRGKVVLLNFWATWCPPCRQELARVQRDIIDRFAGRDFVFLPVSRGESRETVAAFREKTGYTFPMGLDPDRAIFDSYAPTTIPRNYLIDREGRVLLAETGYTPESFDRLVQEVGRALDE